MGIDKEATDIWLFGKPRPDLTMEQTVEEAKKRREAIDARARELLKQMPELDPLARTPPSAETAMNWRDALDDPETNERLKHIDALLALQICVHKGWMNEAMYARGKAFLDRFIAGIADHRDRLYVEPEKTKDRRLAPHENEPPTLP
jgi:hypothetical protein